MSFLLPVFKFHCGKHVRPAIISLRYTSCLEAGFYNGCRRWQTGGYKQYYQVGVYIHKSYIFFMINIS